MSKAAFNADAFLIALFLDSVCKREFPKDLVEFIASTLIIY